MNAFVYSGFAQDIRFGPGKVEALSEIISSYGWSRVLFCTSGSHRRAGRAGTIEDVLGDALAATVDDVQQHVQEEQVDQTVEVAQARDVDAIVALGGGSVLGIAKAVSDAVQKHRTGTYARDAGPLEPVSVPVVAIPTTYAGSEMTTVYGVTRSVEGVRRKFTVSGRNIVPRVVIYDPELTADLPPELTGTSAMNALAHCFEALYSPKRNPLSTWSSLGGIQAIMEALPAATARGDDLEARSRLLEGAFLAGAALSQVAMAIHHGVCHVLGGSAGVPHGVANTIVLPHALRFNREVAANELAPAAVVLNLAGPDMDPLAATDRVIEAVDGMAETLGLPRRLRDNGVDENDLPGLAKIVLAGGPVHNNPRRVRGADEVVAFLRAML